MPILAPPVPIPPILVGVLTLLSTFIAGVRKAAALRAKPASAGQPRRFFNYPVLAPISLLSLLGFAAGSLYYDFKPPAQNSAAYTALAVGLLVANIGVLACWIYTIGRSAQLGRRDWVINMLSGIALGSPLFSSWGPTERRAASGHGQDPIPPA